MRAAVCAPGVARGASKAGAEAEALIGDIDVVAMVFARRRRHDFVVQTFPELRGRRLQLGSARRTPMCSRSGAVLGDVVDLIVVAGEVLGGERVEVTPALREVWRNVRRFDRAIYFASETPARITVVDAGLACSPPSRQRGNPYNAVPSRNALPDRSDRWIETGDVHAAVRIAMLFLSDA